MAYLHTRTLPSARKKTPVSRPLAPQQRARSHSVCRGQPGGRGRQLRDPFHSLCPCNPSAANRIEYPTAFWIKRPIKHSHQQRSHAGWDSFGCHQARAAARTTGRAWRLCNVCFRLVSLACFCVGRLLIGGSYVGINRDAVEQSWTCVWLENQKFTSPRPGRLYLTTNYVAFLRNKSDDPGRWVVPTALHHHPDVGLRAALLTLEIG
jgi:hypothetical protein